MDFLDKSILLLKEILTHVVPDEFEAQHVKKGWQFGEIVATEWFLLHVHLFVVQNTANEK